jgi:hypothetical protein
LAIGDQVAALFVQVSKVRRHTPPQVWRQPFGQSMSESQRRSPLMRKVMLGAVAVVVFLQKSLRGRPLAGHGRGRASVSERRRFAVVVARSVV